MALAIGMTAGIVGLPMPAASGSETFSMRMNSAVVDQGRAVFGYPGVDLTNDAISSPGTVFKIDGEIEGVELFSSPLDVDIGESLVPARTSTDAFEVDWHASGPLTGTFDESTGELNLRVVLTQTITSRDARCSVGPLGVGLSSDSSTSAGSGVRFVEGLSGPGAVAGSWFLTPPPGGSDCDLRRLGCDARHNLIRGPGAMAIGRDVELEASKWTETDWSFDKFGIDGTLKDGGCKPDGVDPPGPPERPHPGPDLGATIEFRRHGQRGLIAKVTVTNDGGAATGVRICGRSKIALIRGVRCHKAVELETGKSVRTKFRLWLPAGREKRLRAMRRGSLTIRLTADGAAPTKMVRGFRGGRLK